jgi:hypothetical protein
VKRTVGQTAARQSGIHFGHAKGQTPGFFHRRGFERGDALTQISNHTV